MKSIKHTILPTLIFILALAIAPHFSLEPDAPARGPLRVHPDNPRYFTDGSGKAVYLTGLHTWGRADPPEPFAFDAYLDFLQRHGHNFIRFWAWDSTVWHTQANRQLGKDFVHNVAPLPWARTGTSDCRRALARRGGAGFMCR